MIKFCKNCADKQITHDFQDKNYGKFIRLHNPSEKKGGVCTVCGQSSK